MYEDEKVSQLLEDVQLVGLLTRNLEKNIKVTNKEESNDKVLIKGLPNTQMSVSSIKRQIVEIRSLLLIITKQIS